MARKKAQLERQFALHRHIRLRQRYILTRHNTIRLRYVMVSLLTLLLAVSTGFSLINSKSYDGQAQASVHRDSDGNHERRSFEIAETGNMALPQTNDIISRIANSLRRHIPASKIGRKPEPLRKTVVVGKGDTVTGVLERAGIGKTQAYYAVKALSKHLDPRRVKPGQEISLQFARGQDAQGNQSRKLDTMQVNFDKIKSVVVSKAEGNAFKSALKKKSVSAKASGQFAQIETSLYGSAARAGIPSAIVAEVIRIYSWNVDFQRDIRRGDKIEVLYNTYETEDGDFAKYGDVLYANLSVGGKDMPVYRFKQDSGDVDYFEPNGLSVKKALMKTPIDGARLSSGYGMRKHPVLGYNKMHKGTDFAAPTGTPIYAAGDGTIERMNRFGAYGNYVRIRHNAKLKTAYAHLHKFKRGLGTGSRVKQGDVIGYVGSTGRSTGAHLHYEVLVNNVQANPKRIDLPLGDKLKGTQLAKFKSAMGSVKQKYAGLVGDLKFAQR